MQNLVSKKHNIAQVIRVKKGFFVKPYFLPPKKTCLKIFLYCLQTGNYHVSLQTEKMKGKIIKIIKAHSGVT